MNGSCLPKALCSLMLVALLSTPAFSGPVFNPSSNAVATFRADNGSSGIPASTMMFSGAAGNINSPLNFMPQFSKTLTDGADSASATGDIGYFSNPSPYGYAISYYPSSMGVGQTRLGGSFDGASTLNLDYDLNFDVDSTGWNGPLFVYQLFVLHFDLTEAGDEASFDADFTYTLDSGGGSPITKNLHISDSRSFGDGKSPLAVLFDYDLLTSSPITPGTSYSIEGDITYSSTDDAKAMVSLSDQLFRDQQKTQLPYDAFEKIGLPRELWKQHGNGVFVGNGSSTIPNPGTDNIVSFSYDANSADHYVRQLSALGPPHPQALDYEEDTIFGPNAVNDPLHPDIRFIGQGENSAIDTDAMSYGYNIDPLLHAKLPQNRDLVPQLSVFFSVAHSDGSPGTAVNDEGAPNERNSDIFVSDAEGNNRQVYDGNGIDSQPGARKLGLIEEGSTFVDALDMRAQWKQDLWMGKRPDSGRDSSLLYWSVISDNGVGGSIPQPPYHVPDLALDIIDPGDIGGPILDGGILINQPQVEYSDNISITPNANMEMTVLAELGDLDETVASEPIDPHYFGSDIFVGKAQDKYSSNSPILKYADKAQLGLTDRDDIDGLVVVDLDGRPTKFNSDSDIIFFSLKRGSLSLEPDYEKFIGGAAVNKSAADIYYVGKGYSVARLYSAAELGLLPSDDIAAFDFANMELLQRMTGPIPGDANFDGIVDVADLGIVGANFSLSGTSFSQGNFNDDGIVDVADLGILGANWGVGFGISGMALGQNTNVVSTVPEPATGLLLIIGAALAKTRRGTRKAIAR